MFNLNSYTKIVCFFSLLIRHLSTVMTSIKFYLLQRHEALQSMRGGCFIFDPLFLK